MCKFCFLTNRQILVHSKASSKLSCSVKGYSTLHNMQCVALQAHPPWKKANCKQVSQITIGLAHRINASSPPSLRNSLGDIYFYGISELVLTVSPPAWVCFLLPLCCLSDNEDYSRAFFWLFLNYFCHCTLHSCNYCISKKWHVILLPKLSLITIHIFFTLDCHSGKVL